MANKLIPFVLSAFLASPTSVLALSGSEGSEGCSVANTQCDGRSSESSSSGVGALLALAVAGGIYYWLAKDDSADTSYPMHVNEKEEDKETFQPDFHINADDDSVSIDIEFKF